MEGGREGGRILVLCRLRVGGWLFILWMIEERFVFVVCFILNIIG